MNNFIFDPSLKFLNPEKVMFAAGLQAGQTVADLGAGSGFYTFASGKIVGEKGKVFAVDILESAIEHISAEARLRELKNVKTLRADLEKSDSCSSIATGTIDLVILANIIHQLKQKKNLFVEAYRMLKTGGKVLVLEWNDSPSVIGPTVHSRISPEEIAKLSKEVLLKAAGAIPADMYHYGLMFIK